MAETFYFGLLGAEDIEQGHGTFGPVTLPDGSSASLNKIGIHTFLGPSYLSAADFSGADAGAKITAAIAALPATGGVVDARSLVDAQDAANTITINKPVLLLFSVITLTGGAAANPVIDITSDDAFVLGVGWESTCIKSTTAANGGIRYNNKSRVRVSGVYVLQTAGSPTGTGVIGTGGNNNCFSDSLVYGFRDGLSFTNTSSIQIRNALAQYCSRDGVRILGSVGFPNIDPYLDYVYAQNCGGKGIVIDGNVSGLHAKFCSGLTNDTGISIQSSIGSGTPSQLWLTECLADSNTTTGWSITAGNQMTITNPWSANRGTRNFYINGATNVSIIRPMLFGFKGHGLETVGVGGVDIIDPYINDSNENTANSKDGINIDATSGGVTVSGGGVGNANLRYAINIAAGATTYKIIGVQMVSGGTGKLNDAAAASDRVILGNPGIDSYLPGGLTITSDYVWKSSTSFTGTLRHNNSVNRNYDFPDADMTLAFGTYTPTLTNDTNVAASTAHVCQYMRLGNIVTVSGMAEVDPTGAGAVILIMTLPIASTGIANVYDVAGTAGTNEVAGQSAIINADTVGKKASMRWIAVDTANRPMYFTYTYQIL